MSVLDNPTGNGAMTRIRNFFAALSRRFHGFRGAFAGSAALLRRLRAASHTAQWCLRKDSQPFCKVSQLRIRVIAPLPVGFSSADIGACLLAATSCWQADAMRLLCSAQHRVALRWLWLDGTTAVTIHIHHGAQATCVDRQPPESESMSTRKNKIQHGATGKAC